MVERTEESVEERKNRSGGRARTVEETDDSVEEQINCQDQRA